MNPKINTDRLLRELHHLATFTDCPPTQDASLPAPTQAVTRIVFTTRDLEARAWLTGLAEDAGFGVRVDPVGNIFIRWQGSSPGLPAVATGSHTDAIPHAGMYDGTVGVLGRPGSHARAQGIRLPAPSAPSRPSCSPARSPPASASAASAPASSPESSHPKPQTQLPDRLPETDPTATPGLTLKARPAKPRGSTGGLAEVRLQPNHYAAWVELHIEQGPLLEREETQLGIVTGIAAPASYRYVSSRHRRARRRAPHARPPRRPLRRR